MDVLLTVGTRPEIVKMAPVLRACRALGLECALVHTGQHYDFELDGVFFRDLDLDPPDLRLSVGSGSREEQIARTRKAVAEVVRELRPRAVLVQGDTNSVLGSALGALDGGAAVGHVEAGLRCGDMRMAEEHNRIETDHISSLCFAPTGGSRENLLAESVLPTRIAVTGNTVVDELQRQLPRRRGEVLERLELGPDGYLLATVHRRENVEDDAALRAVFQGILNASEEADLPVVAALHPRTRQRIAELGLHMEGALRVLPPLGYLEFLALHQAARLVLTDSGGVQEEACVLQVPCVVLRACTERPESAQVGGAHLAGCDTRRIVEAARTALAAPRSWENPFGDGKSGEHIAALTAGFHWDA